MKLAVRKEEGSIPGGGFYYMLHPLSMKSDVEAAIMEQTGHVIIEVSDDHGVRLLASACAALSHQVEVAFIVEETLSK